MTQQHSLGLCWWGEKKEQNRSLLSHSCKQWRQLTVNRLSHLTIFLTKRLIYTASTAVAWQYSRFLLGVIWGCNEKFNFRIRLYFATVKVGRPYDGVRVVKIYAISAWRTGQTRLMTPTSEKRLFWFASCPQASATVASQMDGNTGRRTCALLSGEHHFARLTREPAEAPVAATKCWCSWVDAYWRCCRDLVPRPHRCLQPSRLGSGPD